MTQLKQLFKENDLKSLLNMVCLRFDPALRVLSGSVQ